MFLVEFIAHNCGRFYWEGSKTPIKRATINILHWLTATHQRSSRRQANVTDFYLNGTNLTIFFLSLFYMRDLELRLFLCPSVSTFFKIGNYVLCGMEFSFTPSSYNYWH